ncbi:MAG: hypothetical protein CM15mV18_0980 [uncultured marine virus]|nr:MAG: hypothetical protein CM15mV18_0980 [uncultured marine virus]
MILKKMLKDRTKTDYSTYKKGSYHDYDVVVINHRMGKQPKNEMGDK